MRLWELGDIVDVLEALGSGLAGEKYAGDCSRRTCADWCLRLLVRCH